MKYGLLLVTAGVAVTGPPGSLTSLTVSATVVVRESAGEVEVAVIVTFAAPSVAVLEAVNVAVTALPVVAVAGLNATVTPVGSPVALIITPPVKLVRLIAIEVPALAPRATETGLADTVKSPVAVTLSDTVAVRESAGEADVAVIAKLAMPSVAVLDALNVAVTELPVVGVAGFSTTVTPLGSGPTLNVTGPVKLVRVIVSVVGTLPPRTNASDPGDAATAKSGVTACVVALSAAVAGDCLPDASSARTVYENVVPAASPVSVNVRPVGLPTTVAPRST
jgi:hypothetical protein